MSLNVGLLGVGKMGQNHLRCLKEMDINIAFIYDFDKELCQKLSNEYNVKISTNLENDMANLNAIIIVTPTFTHNEYINLASKFCKNIFVEKPLCDTLESSKQIQDLAKEKGLNIQVGFIERYNPALLELKKLGLKDAFSMDFTRSGLASARIKDVDVVIDLMIHDIDLALHLNGDAKVLCAYGKEQDGVIEMASAILRHENGVFSRILASRITHKKERRILVNSKNSFIDCDLLNKKIEIIEGENSRILESQNHNALSAELSDFFALCKGSKNTGANENDGVFAMKIANEIQKQIKAL